MILKNNLFINVFFIIFLSLFFVGCQKKIKDNEKIDIFKNEKFELQSILKDEAIEAGIIILEDSKEINAFKEDNFVVCDYLIDLESKVESLEKLKNFINPIQKIYIQNGWILEDHIFGKTYISIMGNKEKQSICIVCIYKYVKKLNKYEITLHTAINNVII